MDMSQCSHETISENRLDKSSTSKLNALSSEINNMAQDHCSRTFQHYSDDANVEDADLTKLNNDALDLNVLPSLRSESTIGKIVSEERIDRSRDVTPDRSSIRSNNIDNESQSTLCKSESYSIVQNCDNYIEKPMVEEKQLESMQCAEVSELPLEYCNTTQMEETNTVLATNNEEKAEEETEEVVEAEEKNITTQATYQQEIIKEPSTSLTDIIEKITVETAVVSQTEPEEPTEIARSVVSNGDPPVLRYLSEEFRAQLPAVVPRKKFMIATVSSSISNSKPPRLLRTMAELTAKFKNSVTSLEENENEITATTNGNEKKKTIK